MQSRKALLDRKAARLELTLLNFFRDGGGGGNGWEWGSRLMVPSWHHPRPSQKAHRQGADFLQPEPPPLPEPTFKCHREKPKAWAPGWWRAEGRAGGQVPSCHPSSSRKWQVIAENPGRRPMPEEQPRGFSPSEHGSSSSNGVAPEA